MQPEMKYIYTVYQCGSFSKAAVACVPVRFPMPEASFPVASAAVIGFAILRD